MPSLPLPFHYEIFPLFSHDVVQPPSEGDLCKAFRLPHLSSAPSFPDQSGSSGKALFLCSRLSPGSLFFRVPWPRRASPSSFISAPIPFFGRVCSLCDKGWDHRLFPPLRDPRIPPLMVYVGSSHFSLDEAPAQIVPVMRVNASHSHPPSLLRWSFLYSPSKEEKGSFPISPQQFSGPPLTKRFLHPWETSRRLGMSHELKSKTPPFLFARPSPTTSLPLSSA